MLHVNRLAGEPTLLDGFDLLAIPGGFSYGDDVAAGRILGDRLARELGPALRAFVDRGGPIIGPCNGFQTLVQAGLLPGEVEGVEGRACALAQNSDAATGGRYACRWVTVRKASPRCVWTKEFGEDESIELPMAHAEGRLVFHDDTTRDAVEQAGRVAMKYVAPREALPDDLPYNPNGSDGDVAGLCDETGLVLGLMPHPERYLDATQHPAWTRRQSQGDAAVEPAGLRLFRSAVKHVMKA
jgi:phosphoribosylformylglycinamidine synthase